VQLVDALSLILTMLQNFIMLFNTELCLPNGTVPVLAMLQRAIKHKRQDITTDQGIALAVTLIHFLLFYKSSFNLFICFSSYESIDSDWRPKDITNIKANKDILKISKLSKDLSKDEQHQHNGFKDRQYQYDSFKEIISRCIVNIYYIGLKLYFECSKTIFRA